MTTETHPATCPIGAGHKGPCPTLCDACYGDGRCPECHGINSDVCDECEGWGFCPAGCNDGTVDR